MPRSGWRPSPTTATCGWKFDTRQGSLVLWLAEDLVQTLSTVLTAAVGDLKYVRENPTYEHRVVHISTD